jgi:hypothetical protein
MSEENPTTNAASNVVDSLYKEMGIGSLFISQLINGVLRKEIIKSLIAAGILTREQLSAALDRAQREANEVCDSVKADTQATKARAIVQEMRDTTEEIVADMRKIIDASS